MHWGGGGRKEFNLQFSQYITVDSLPKITRRYTQWYKIYIKSSDIQPSVSTQCSDINEVPRSYLWAKTTTASKVWDCL